MTDIRIGHGYDVHRLTENRPLILGGVKIEYELGLLGHSDADVLLHAVCDALLGAAGLGDIGRHFPDTDDRYLDVSSLHLLTLVKAKMDARRASLVNADITLILQKPKIAGYIEKMKRNIAFALACDESRVNVKATTEEHLGFTGRCEGIAAHAVALIEKKES